MSPTILEYDTNSMEAIKVIEANLKKLGFAKQVTFLEMDAIVPNGNNKVVIYQNMLRGFGSVVLHVEDRDYGDGIYDRTHIKIAYVDIDKERTETVDNSIRETVDIFKAKEKAGKGKQ